VKVEIARDWLDWVTAVSSLAALIVAVVAAMLASRSAAASDRSAEAADQTALAAREDAEQTRELVSQVREQLAIQREQHEHFVAEQAKRPQLFVDLVLSQVLQGQGLILRGTVMNTGDKRADDVRVEFSAPGNTPYRAVPQPGIVMQEGPQLGRLEYGREILAGPGGEMMPACVYAWRIGTLPPGQPEDWYVMLHVVEGVREVRLYAEHDEAGDVSARRLIEFDERGAATVSRI
jgi:hypothetical protein